MNRKIEIDNRAVRIHVSFKKMSPFIVKQLKTNPEYQVKKALKTNIDKKINIFVTQNQLFYFIFFLCIYLFIYFSLWFRSVLFIFIFFSQTLTYFFNRENFKAMFSKLFLHIKLLRF